MLHDVQHKFNYNVTVYVFTELTEEDMFTIVVDL